MQITLRELLSYPLFAPFRDFPYKLQNLVNHAEILKFNKNDVIINEGDDDGGALYFICEGSVVIAKIIDSATGRAKPLATLRKGSYFGEMSLFDKQLRSATVLSTSETYLLRISSSVFDNIIQSDSSISAALLSQIITDTSERLRRTSMELVVLYDTGKFIAQIQDFEMMCDALLQRLCTSLVVFQGAMIVHNPLSDSFDTVAQTENCDTLNDELKQVIIRHTRFLGRGFLSPSPDSTSEIESKTKGLSLLVVPLMHKGKIYGNFFLVRKSPKAQDCCFTDADLNLAVGVAQQAGSAVENIRLRQEEEARMAYSRRRISK